VLGESAFIKGRVRSADGLPFAGCAMSALRVDGTGEESTARCDAEGRFALAADPSARYRLRLTLPGGAAAECTWLGLVVGDAADVDIVVTHDLMEFALVRGTLLDASGRPFEGAVRALHGDGTGAGWAEVDSEGRFRLGPLPVGHLRLIAEAARADLPDFLVLDQPLAIGTDLDIGAVRAPASGTVQVHTTATDAQAIHGYVRTADGAMVTSLSADDSGLATVCLAPGDYTVEVFALRNAGVASTTVSSAVRVTAEQITRVNLEIPQ
jgi:hypothetical protein